MRTLLLFVTTLTVFGQVKPSLMEDAGKENLPSQKLGVDDLIAVSVYDAPELTRTRARRRRTGRFTCRC